MSSASGGVGSAAWALAELEYKTVREALFTLYSCKDKWCQTFLDIEFGTYLALGREKIIKYLNILLHKSVYLKIFAHN